MKIKTLIVLIILCACAFCSCAEENRRIFDYQDGIKEVRASISENEEEYKAVLYFETDEKGKSSVRRIEYSYPENISGLSFTLEGENITAEINKVRIADSWFEKEKVFRFGELFSLAEEDIYEIKTDKKGKTVAKGRNDDISFEITTKNDGTPEKIIYNTKEKCIELTIEEIKRN